MTQKKTPTSVETLTPEEALAKRARERALAAKRESRRATLRFGTKVGVTLTLVLGIAFGADRVAQSVMSLPVFQFSKLELSGNLTRVPIDRVKEVVEPMLKGNYFTEDLEAVRAAVETVPWVSRATVRRVWPNELHVEVEIYQALAIYEDGRLVDTNGVLFSANPDERDNPSEALPNFYGPVTQTAQIARYYREFVRALQPIGATVTDVTCSDRGSWSLVMSSPDIPPTRVELGQEASGSGVIAKLADMAAAYPRVVELMDGPPASIDLRYNRAFAATLPDREAIARLREAKDETESSVEEPDVTQPNE